MKITRGTILTLTHGQYSDYNFDGPFRVLRAFDQAVVSELFTDEWRASHPKREHWEQPKTDEFTAWMATKGFIEDIPESWSWHVGNYIFSPDIDAGKTP